MKMQLTRRIVASFLVITVVMLFSTFSLKSERVVIDEKVRCAVDGMVMNPSAMVKVEQDGKTYYFCSDMQAKMFKANPDKFLQTISVGNLTFDLNVLTIDAYKGMMSHMGMGGMIKADEIKGKTHYVSVYPIEDHTEFVVSYSLGDVKLAVQVTNTEGETRMALLKYSKMTHTYAGFIVMPKGKEHEVRIRVTSPAVKISL